jgi:hypothetical protein
VLLIALCGKVLRRLFDASGAKSPLHMVSAWGCDRRLVFAQIATETKSNEITAMMKHGAQTTDDIFEPFRQSQDHWRP